MWRSRGLGFKGLGFKDLGFKGLGFGGEPHPDYVARCEVPLSRGTGVITSMMVVCRVAVCKTWAFNEFWGLGLECQVLLMF